MKSISRKGGQRIPTWASTLGAVVLMVPVTAVFYYFSVAPLSSWLDAEDWPTVECTITHSEMVIGKNSDGDSTYTLNIVYDYVWDGTAYTSDQFDFAGGSNYSRNTKVALVEKYAEGTQHPCFVNPNAPEEAVLNRDFVLTYLLGVAAMIFFGGLLIGVFLHNRNKHPKSLSAGGKRQERPATTPYRHDAITLKGGNNRILTLVLVTVFAVVWNAIVGMMSVSIFSDLKPGELDWVLLLVFVPFLLIGLGAIGALAYYVLALFNPQPDLTLTPGYLPLGGTASLAWRFRGNPGRIRTLTITLVGEEKATYRRGTDTVTETSRFEVIPLIDTAVPADITQGAVAVIVPEFSAPTFHAPNNKIRWYVKVAGDIPRWPDVSQEFELTVAPLPTGREEATPSLAEFTRK